MNWIYEDGRIYSVDENNKLLAEATFFYKANGGVDIDHTYVTPALRGGGVAGKLMEAVAEYLRKNSLKASASCSYANAWFRKHRESHKDIIAEDIEDDADACRIDGRH